MRSRFAYTVSGGGSGIDTGVVFLSARDVLAYLPRAAAIGLWAPFPASWASTGRSVGSSGRLLAGVETLGIYLCQVLAIAAVLLPPRRMAASLLLMIAAFGVTAEAAVVANLGALYRFRYPFWLLLIVLGVVGLTKLRARRWPSFALILVLFTPSCAGPRTSGSIRIENITGFKIGALYLSPHGAATWQENVLGPDLLDDGGEVTVRFPPAASSTVWDVRIDGVHRYRAEWSGLELSTVSSLTLRIAHNTVVADLEDER